MKIIQSPSPNFSNSDYKKIGWMIHKTLGLMPGTLEWLRAPRSQASSNILVTKDGTIHELVPLDKRSWAAGRINQPSSRALPIMMKTPWGTWVKPGHYLAQIEVECLLTETYTEQQYQAIVEYINSHPEIPFSPETFLTHRDTAVDKPLLENERDEIIKRIGTPSDDPDILVLDNWQQLGIKVEGGKIILYKK